MTTNADALDDPETPVDWGAAAAGVSAEPKPDPIRPAGRRRGRPPGSGTTTRAPARSKIEQDIGVLLINANVVLAMASRQDALNGSEIEALADALTDEVMASPKLRRWMTAASGASAHVKLGMVLVSIAIPRLVRHGVIPPLFAPLEEPPPPPFQFVTPDAATGM